MAEGVALPLPKGLTKAAPQRMRALERANRVRLARAELKRGIADGQIAVADVIMNSPWEAESMEIQELLMCQRRWGWTRARKVLAAIPVPENRTVGSLTDRQRRALASKLGQAIPGHQSNRAVRPEERKREWGALEDAARECDELSERLEKAMAKRDAHVLTLSRLGVSRRAVAAVARITTGRVQQIVTAAGGTEQQLEWREGKPSETDVAATR
jgi:hypothetical protein